MRSSTRRRLDTCLFIAVMAAISIGTRASFVKGTQRAFSEQRVSTGTTRHAQTSLFSSAWSRTLPVGVIFDMDGTLVEPCIDFADMRRRIYDVASSDLNRNITDGCVLELASLLSPEGQSHAKNVFDDIESKAIQDMKFMDGMEDLCHFLDSQGIRRALLTRNVERSVEAFHDKLERRLPFQPAVARDTLDGSGNSIPAKPQPHAIHYICQEWNCDASQVIMVGDSAKDDIVAANRAGCSSVLLQVCDKDNNSGNGHDSTPEERTPTLVVSSLSELHEMLLSAVDDEVYVSGNRTR